MSTETHGRHENLGHGLRMRGHFCFNKSFVFKCPAFYYFFWFYYLKYQVQYFLPSYIFPLHAIKMALRRVVFLKHSVEMMTFISCLCLHTANHSNTEQNVRLVMFSTFPSAPRHKKQPFLFTLQIWNHAERYWTFLISIIAPFFLVVNISLRVLIKLLFFRGKFQVWGVKMFSVVKYKTPVISFHFTLFAKHCLFVHAVAQTDCMLVFNYACLCEHTLHWEFNLLDVDG